VAAKRVIGTAGADLGDRLAIENLVWQHARVTDPATNDCDGSLLEYPHHFSSEPFAIGLAWTADVS
jgi:hypothetical protein